MKFKPGSFSKNFAWHGTGLRRLYDAIRGGFGGRLEEVRRSAFRANCGIPDPLDLIPINFFLFNKFIGGEERLPVDELVFRAISGEPGPDFDRLALFSLHLSEVGTVSSGGTPWARQFVRERLWKDGYWSPDELAADRIESFLADVLDARPDVIRKCATNYHHILELCHLDSSDRSAQLDNRTAAWLPWALYLAWDRAILGGSLHPTQVHLSAFCREKLIAPLLGVPAEFADELAASLSQAYLDAGGIARFAKHLSTVADVKAKGPLIDTTSGAPAATILDLIGREAAQGQVKRAQRLVLAQLRDPRLAVSLKEHYKNRCMFCEVRLVISVSPEECSAEAAHIKPLGRPYNGSDLISNMLVLCPNCHCQFDAGVLVLEQRGSEGLRIASLAERHPLDGKRVQVLPPHSVDPEVISWHTAYFKAKHIRAESP